MHEIVLNKTILKDGKTFEQIASDRRDSVQNLADPASFEEIFGNLSDCKVTMLNSKQSEFNISQLGLSSLKGCPKVIDINLHITSNPDLINLDFFPVEVLGYINVQNCKNLESLKGIEALQTRSIGDLYFLENPSLKDISSLMEVAQNLSETIYLSELPLSAIDIVKALWLKRQASGNWKFLASIHESSALEKLYVIYEKLNFNQEKFDRVVQLL